MAVASRLAPSSSASSLAVACPTFSKAVRMVYRVSFMLVFVVVDPLLTTVLTTSVRRHFVACKSPARRYATVDINQGRQAVDAGSRPQHHQGRTIGAFQSDPRLPFGAGDCWEGLVAR